MAVKVKPEFIDVEKVRGAHGKIEIDIFCINWKEVIKAARAEGKRIEEILGVPVLKPYPKPDNFEKRFQETLERHSQRTGKTKKEILDEAKVRSSAYEAFERRAKELGVTTDELFIIDRLMIHYSSFDPEDFADLKGL